MSARIAAFVTDTLLVRSSVLHVGTAYRQAGPSGDETDAAIGRQFSQSSALTRSSMGGRRRTLHKKDSVAKIAIDGLSTALVRLSLAYYPFITSIDVYHAQHVEPF